MARLVPLRSCLPALLALAAAAAAAAEPPPLARAYARYLAQGRSEVEIHLAEGTGDASARLRPLGSAAGGRWRCDVQGLPEGQAGVLVHEVTHCLVGPYLAPVRDAAPDAAAERLVLLASESISDARAVIEVFRADGLAAAEALAATMQAQRLAAASPVHATAPALQAALQAVRQGPQSLQAAEAAFAAALAIGRDAAAASLGQAVPPALDEALAHARRAFAQGRLDNAAMTLHAGVEDGGAAADRHWFVSPDGRLRDEALLGSEGAHARVALQQMLAADAPPERRLAERWLRRQGRLDLPMLERVTQVLSRFVGAYGARALPVLQAGIDEAPRQADLGDLLDEAAQRLQQAP